MQGIPFHERFPLAKEQLRGADGVLFSKGEPLGASALGQVVELVLQLRGRAGPRQVDGARLALGHTVGRGANACVVILRANP